MKRPSVIWILLSMFLCCAAYAEAKIEVAEAAAHEWLRAVDEGDYAAAWALSSSLLREAIEPAELAQALENGRRGFGSVVSRERLGAVSTTTLPGAPDGNYVVFTFQAQFENKKDGIETVTPRLEDGVWKVSGYYVR